MTRSSFTVSRRRFNSFCKHCSYCPYTGLLQAVSGFCLPFLRSPGWTALCAPAYPSHSVLSLCRQLPTFSAFFMPSSFLTVTPACTGSALPLSFSFPKVLWLRLTSARSARLSYMAVVTPFGAFRPDLPGYHTFLFLHLPAASTTCDSVQLLGLDLACSLTLAWSLLCGFRSSGQRFARG